MSDRYKGLVVSLEMDFKDEDAQVIIDAIKMIKGVSDVKPVVREYEDFINRDRIRREVQEKIMDVVRSITVVI